MHTVAKILRSFVVVSSGGLKTAAVTDAQWINILTHLWLLSVACIQQAWGSASPDFSA
jgi:hypothetical protein